MRQVELPFAELFGIAATRGMLGAGLALLLGERLHPHQRRILGGILTAIGVLTTVPFAYDVLSRRRISRAGKSQAIRMRDSGRRGQSHSHSFM